MLVTATDRARAVIDGRLTGTMALQTCPTPKFIDYAAPGNRQCGVCPTDLPEQLQAYCGRMTESVQG